MQQFLGMMTGTSVDGIDAALIESDGLELVRPETRVGVMEPYSKQIRPMLLAATQAALNLPTETLADRTLWPAWLVAAEHLVTETHAEVIRQFDIDQIDYIGFHGQTLVHRPNEGFTLQIGDGALLAQEVGLPVIWDFRQNDMLHGGQGAPLAPFYHFTLTKSAQLKEPVAFVNIGGVANVTLINPAFDSPEMDGALLAFDTGPGNGPIDDLIFRQTKGKQTYDAFGHLAAQGQVNRELVEAFLAQDFFQLSPPKSLDRHAFDYQAVTQLSAPEAVATLTAITIESVALAFHHAGWNPKTVYICGGGRKNLTLMQGLTDRLAPAMVGPVEALGGNGDLLEAEAFGFLAARSLAGLPLSAPLTTGCKEPVSGGRLSRP